MTARADFWARRKAAVRAEAEAETKALHAAEAAQARSALEDRDDADILAELNLPDPDSLAPGDDVRAFMSQHVPERLRKRALRRLWRTNPVLANLDGLNDYDGDLTDAAFVTGIVETTYKVGRGLQAHIDALAEPAADHAVAEAENEYPLPEDARPVETAPPADGIAATERGDDADIVVSADTAPEHARTGEPDAPDMPVARRRMRFSYRT